MAHNIAIILILVEGLLWCKFQQVIWMFMLNILPWDLLTLMGSNICDGLVWEWFCQSSDKAGKWPCCCFQQGQQASLIFCCNQLFSCTKILFISAFSQNFNKELLQEQCTFLSQEHLWDQRWDCWLLAPSEHGELSCTWRACSRKKQMHLPSQMEHMPRDKCNSVGSINRKVGVETLCL